MQRVKAHDLRQKDEAGLVEELGKFRVSISWFLMLACSLLERARSAQSFQGLSCPPGQACSHKSCEKGHR